MRASPFHTRWVAMYCVWMYMDRSCGVFSCSCIHVLRYVINS